MNTSAPWEDFSRLTTKFLFLNCNNGGDESATRDLNSILDDLNGLSYQGQKFVDEKSAMRLIESFANIDTKDETLIVKACYLLTNLVKRQKVPIISHSFGAAVQWLLSCFRDNFPDIAGEVLKAMHAIFTYNQQSLEPFRESLLAPHGPLLSLLTTKKIDEKKRNYDGCSSDEIAQATILCIESLIPSADDSNLPDNIVEHLDVVGSEIIRILYSPKIEFKNPVTFCIYHTSALMVLQKVGSVNQAWLERNLGEIIGLGKAFMLHGLPGVEHHVPQKTNISQQTILEPTSSQVNKGGKVSKTRKPRSMSKSKKKDVRIKNTTSEEFGRENSLRFDYDSAILSSFNKTSESDYSETETGRTQSEMHKQSKLRMAAISLFGLIAKDIEKKIIYGYWHALFPSESLTITSRVLLNCVLRDPNPRCRVAALQATSIFLFGSKPYLSQAESRKTPSAFMPFSISLGHMILSIYESLTQALSAESSLPVLTQILKCLGVVIQVTPFHRLDNSFVPHFVKYIRRLIYHKDATIQVAALMVMEFLISVNEITYGILECVGLPKNALRTTTKTPNLLHNIGSDDVIEPQDEEEFIDSDFEDESQEKEETDKMQEQTTPKMSWLLQKVLNNLGGMRSQDITTLAAIPVRIQSLQVLSCMARHFSVLSNHLDLIGIVLEKSLNDPQADIRHYTGKALDMIGHAMSTHLLEIGAKDADELTVCVAFWIKILPSVIKNIQDQTQSATLKTTLCDFMSNIGVHVYERLPHSTHMQLVSLLSGASFNEENSVRASAVRALAVYALFPSLREDLCFIENTAESIIQLLGDGNIFVRIKASWSMGNISDALITNCVQTKSDQISNDLLKRMIETTTESAGDSDKVRCNAVRALGNLLRLLTSEHLQSPQWLEIFKKSIGKLVQNLNSGSNAKVKWNTCYAIGNFMKNEVLFTNCKEFNWQQIVFTSLTEIVVNNANFKVRINAATALTTISKRKLYGQHLPLIWKALLLALDQSNNLPDLNEYKHRDHLQEQICLTICHVIKLSATDDYLILKNELIPTLETIKETWSHVINRILPENAAPLLSCAAYLNELLERSDLGKEHRNAVQILASCFVSPQPEF